MGWIVRAMESPARRQGAPYHFYHKSGELRLTALLLIIYIVLDL